MRHCHLEASQKGRSVLGKLKLRETRVKSSSNFHIPPASLQQRTTLQTHNFTLLPSQVHPPSSTSLRAIPPSTQPFPLDLVFGNSRFLISLSLSPSHSHILIPTDVARLRFSRKTPQRPHYLLAQILRDNTLESACSSTESML